MIGLILTMMVGFLAVAAFVMGVALLARDLFARRQHANDEPQLVLPEIAEDKRSFVDDWFLTLVEQSGARLNLATSLSLIVGAAVVGVAIPLVLFEDFIFAAVGLLIAVALVLIVLGVMRWWRLRQMQNSLPEALQIVSDSVRSGLTLEESFEMVAKDLKGALAEEFRYGGSQLRLGHSPVSVLRGMARRVPLTEFRIFATAVVVHNRTGGNLAMLTERLSTAARDREEIAGHLLAVTAGSRLSAFGMVCGAILAMVFLVWLEPEYLSKFVEHHLGPTLLMVAIGLQLVGIVWVWRILRVRY